MGSLLIRDKEFVSGAFCVSRPKKMDKFLTSVWNFNGVVDGAAGKD